jgi:hypothetical protein
MGGLGTFLSGTAPFFLEDQFPEVFPDPVHVPTQIGRASSNK